MAFFPHIQAPRPEVRAFLEDIREHPEDDTSRLVLADWLDDNGDEVDRARAEFIRLQCLLARPGIAPRCWGFRQQFLLEQYAEDWLGPLVDLVDGWRFERGLLHLALQGHRCFASELHELLHTETFAWVEGLTLREVTGGFINVAEQLPLLRHIQKLTIEESQPGEPALRRLFMLTALSGLRELNLAGCHVSASAIVVLANQSRLSRLQALDLTRNYAGEMAVQALAGSERLPELRHLSLGYNQVPDGALAVLADSPLLGRLEYLDLRGNLGCGGAGLAALLQSPRASNLQRLNLDQLRPTQQTIRALFQSSSLNQLRQLYLDRTNLGSEALKLLAFGQGLPRLEVVSLARNNFTDAGIIALAHATSPFRPRVLNLSHNYIDRDGAVAISTSPVFENLRELDLEDNQIGDEGALALAGSPLLRNLHFLDVGNNDLSALGKAVLLRRFGRDVVLV